MKIKISIFVVVLLMAFAISASAGVIGSGTLNFSDTISATQQWASTSTQLTWEVSKTAGSPYHYEYTFTVPAKSISHMIIEVSDTFTSDNLLNFGWSSNSVSDVDYEIGDYSSSNGKSNPNMPSLMRGIKIGPTAMEGKDVLDLTVWFDSYRVPVIGDFYAKSGKDVTAWNTGFGSPDSDLTTNNHILRPDTVSVVPEPSSIVVLGMSLLSLGGMLKLKKK